MKYAVIQIGGKQFKVSEGDVLKLERQNELNIDVLMHSENENVLIGQPFVEDIEVEASILVNKLDKKVVVGRYRSKSRYRKLKGHRQPISMIQIESIHKVGEKPVKEKAEVESVKAEKESKVEKKPAAKEATTKRGRPKKSETQKEAPAKRGRPKKEATKDKKVTTKKKESK